MTLAEAQVRRTATLTTLGAIVLCVALVAAVPDLREIATSAARADTEAVREQVDGLGWSGVALLALLMMVHAVVPYPTEIPTAAAGFLYGFWWGTAFCLTMWLLSALATYEIGRHLGRPAIRRLVGAERTDRAWAWVADGGPVLLLAARLVPVVPFSLTGYVAGAAHLPRFRFGWTTVVGYAPLTMVFVYLGTRLETLHLDDPRLWLALAPLAAALGIGVWIERRRRRRAAAQS